MKKCVCPPPNTDGAGRSRPAPKVRPGQVDVVVSMYFFLTVLIVAMFQYKIYTIMPAGAYVEDALAASNLASALIDVKEYGISHTVRIGDTREAFSVYSDALYCNLALDEEGYSAREELLTGKVQIREYIVYNVTDGEVEITVYDGEGNCLRQESARPGSVRTPDGIPVEHTTVYSRVGFQVMGLMGRGIDAEKEKSVDIVRYGEDE